MGEPRTVEIKASWRTLALLVAMCAALYLVYRGFLSADQKFGTLKGAWIDELPLEAKRGFLLCVGGLCGLLAATLLPPLLFGVPLARLDKGGIYRYGLFGRKSIRWANILSVDDTTSDRRKITWSNAGHHQLRIRPISSDSDQRNLIFPWLTIDINGLVDQIYEFRPDLVSIPQRVIRQRALEPKETPTAIVSKRRPPEPPIVVDPSKWTG